METNALVSLETATKLLQLHNSSIVLVKDAKVLYESNAKGIFPYVEAVESLGHSLKGAALADRIAGRAAALLSAYVGVSLAYAETISEGALEVFAKHKIPCKYDKKVSMILNRDKTNQCPFEHAVSDLQNPQEAFQRLKQATRMAKPNKP
jgi:hypothetical protein